MEGKKEKKELTDNMEPMESFLQLSGVTIQKIASDPVREEKESPKRVEGSDFSESSDDESVERQDESDCKGDVESDADLSEREEDDCDEPEESKVTKKEPADAEASIDQTQPDAKAEKEGAEGETELEVKPSVEVKTETASKRKKRKKNDPERDCIRKKKRKKRNKEPKVDTDSDEERLIEQNKRMKNLRKNIREVMNENELDVETKAAQREEMERLMRVQEQQKMLKEMQRQILLDRQKTLFQSLGQSPSLYRNCTITPMTLNREAAPSGSAGPLDDSRYPDCGTTPGGASVTLVHKSKEEIASETDLRSLAQLDSLPDLSSLCPAPKKASELVTISSSDDDCMIVSGGSEAESEPEDPTNSGLHTNDVFNIPDAQGQVLINVGHPKNEPDIFLAPQVARVIKPHQIGGIRFLYDNVVESLERYKTSAGFGCILAHSMGLGKTLQVVSFCDIFLRKTSARHILCIMPINTLQNWLAEFNMWMPAESAVNGDAEPGQEIRPRAFGLFLLNDSQKTLTARAKVIRQWRHDGGVLLIGYELYRLLSLRRDKLSKKKKFISLIDIEDEGNRKKALWSEIHDALIKPGPDLVICDEGHRIKNSHASISHALKSMQTKRRVVLTGYPLQNNLIEYWCMVDFVRPNYLGTKTEFCNMFERPIQNGQCVDSTPSDVKLMRYRAHVLHSLLNGFVQRRSHAVLRDALPQKNEYVMLFRMTPLQRDLYTCFMNDVVRTKAVPNPLKAFAVCCKIWNHPDVLYYFLKKRMEGEDLDLEDAVLAKAAAANVLATPQNDSPLKNQLQNQPLTGEPNSTDNKSSVLATSQSSGFNQNFEFGEPSGQFNPQYQQEFFNSMQPGYQQPTGQFSRQPFQLPHTQNFGEQQNWSQSSFGDNQSSLGSTAYHDPYGLPTTLEQHTGKNDRLMEMIDKTVDHKEIDSIEKMIDEKIEGKKEEVIKGLLESGSNMPRRGDETSIPYDWATEILKGYEPGVISNSAKMEALFCILEESLKIGDRILLFSQSLFTLNLIEDFLHQNVVPGSEVKWAKNLNYFRLDGSTAAVEREKLINEFNSNPKFHLFLVSTRAGSLGINLVGANRVIVFDASWNPCHDTQAVCRVYRYGQVKPCFVYRFVMDNCLEKKIYDRQINKQGMADRVVDELNPDAHLSIKEVSNLLYDSEPENEAKDLSDSVANFRDDIVKTLLKKHSMQLSKLPFQHESLLIDRKDKKLSQAEKRLAKRSYELEKQASTRPGINAYYGGYQGSYSTSGGGIINAAAPPAPPIRHGVRPVASVRPMQAPLRPQAAGGRTRWIPAETWQRQGMTVQEMTLPLDVVIPTNSSDRSISLKAGQRVMVLKSAKGVYMQLENGKIIAIRSTQKSGNDLSSLVDPAAAKKIPMPPNAELGVSTRVNSAVETSNWLRSLPWNAAGNMAEMDPHSSNSSSSTSSTNQFVPYDNKFSPLDVPDVNKLQPSRMVPMNKAPTQPSPSVAFNARKSQSSFVQHPSTNADDLSQTLAMMASGTSLRSSGGGIVVTNHPEQQANAAYPHYSGYNQQAFSDTYGSYQQQSDFSSVPATHQYQQQPQYAAANQYCSPDAFHQPTTTYLNDTFAYQHHQPPPYNSNYATSQNKQQFSQPP